MKESVEQPPPPREGSPSPRPRHHGGGGGSSNSSSGSSAGGTDAAERGAAGGGGRRHSAPQAAASPPHSQQAGPGEGNTTVLLVLFSLSVLSLWVSFASFPALSETESAKIKFPRDLDDVRGLYSVLSRYRDENYGAVLGGFCSAYIFLQTFAIPGAIFLSILAGPLFGVYTGLAIVSCVATLGATMCYLMSYYLGRGLVQRCFPSQLASFRTRVREHGDNLFFYLLFLRISPLLPNWFISVSSPIINVPLLPFVVATFVGLMPANYMHVNTGMQLEELQSARGLNPKALLALFALAFLALVPTLFKKKFEEAESRMRTAHTEN